MNMEMLLRALFKFGGIGEDQMRAMMTTAETLIIDGERHLREANARLARIETHLGIAPLEPETPKELTHGE